MRVLRWLLGALGLVAAAFLAVFLFLYEPLLDRFAPGALDRPLPPASGRTGPRVLLVSVDGLGEAVLAAADTPALDRLATEGTRAAVAETVVPSVTLAAHTSQITGLPPARHGIDWNRYLPWKELRVTSLFTRCAELGLRCGLFAGKAKFVHFAEHEPGIARYRRGRDAADVLAHATDFLREADADLAMIHLAEVDATGHSFGWGSAEQKAAIERVDALLAVFVGAARAVSQRPLAILVTADHGGHGTQHGTDRPEDVRIPWIAWGAGVPAGATLAHVSTLDTAPTLASLLGVPPPPGAEGRARLGGALVDLATTAPGVSIEMRYARADNFLGEAVYPVNRCLLRADTAERLARVQDRLASQGLGLRVWDCYRPQAVQRRMWERVPDPRYVADPAEGSRHSRGAAVDVTLLDAAGRALELPTAHDDFSERAHRGFRALSEVALRNRARLESAMTAEGFLPLPTEWWHFDDPGWRDASLRDVSLDGDAPAARAP
jgi:D-alanyl-D-alanine dipeptidase